MSDKPDDDGDAGIAALKAVVERNRDALDDLWDALFEAKVIFESLPPDDQQLIKRVAGAWSGIGDHISASCAATSALNNMPEAVDDSKAVISFEHDGVSINNPFMSSCGRFEVDPRTYGFNEEETGGGCLALVKRFADGRHIMLTDEGGSQLPGNMQDCMIGLYDGDREMLVCRTMSRQIELADAELMGVEAPKPG